MCKVHSWHCFISAFWSMPNTSKLVLWSKCINISLQYSTDNVWSQFLDHWISKSSDFFIRSYSYIKCYLVQFLCLFSSSMFFDEDGDLAHEFYEEVRIGKRFIMRRKRHNLIPQVQQLPVFIVRGMCGHPCRKCFQQDGNYITIESLCLTCMSI